MRLSSSAARLGVCCSLGWLSLTSSFHSMYVHHGGMRRHYRTTFLKDSHDSATTRSSRFRAWTIPTLRATNALEEPPDSKFGRRDYWNSMYQTPNETFSWYASWDDLEPFFAEVVPDRSSRILLPGIGNDALAIDMYDSGYQSLVAFDYAPESIARIHDILQDREVDLQVADGRNLRDQYSDASFDAILEKGTLDAIYLSGGKDKIKAQRHLDMAVAELTRIAKPGGILMSVTAACVDAVQAAVSEEHWQLLRDGSLYFTEDGYASNNIDGTLLIWRRRGRPQTE